MKQMEMGEHSRDEVVLAGSCTRIHTREIQIHAMTALRSAAGDAEILGLREAFAALLPRQRTYGRSSPPVF